MSTAAELVSRAEHSLVLADFAAAESLGRESLQRAAYLSSHDATNIRERACCCVLQALAETGRFASARRLLRESCGPQLSDAPPHTLLLWLALALDTDTRGEAQQLIHDLLDTRQPGSPEGWSRRQYLTLLHLYVFEVLLREMREAAEVMRWVQETQLPVTGEERQMLLDELAEAGAADAQHRQERTQQAQRAQQGDGGASGTGGGGQAVGAAALRQPAEALAADKTGAFVRQAPVHAGTGRNARPAQRAAPGGSAAAAGTQEAAPEIVPAEEEPAEQGGASSSDWLGRCQQHACQALAAVLQPLLPAQPGQQAQAAGDPAATLRMLGGTCLGVVLLYAAFTERQTIQQGVRRARRGVAAAAGDVLRMAFSIQPNPLAASAPSWR